MATITDDKVPIQIRARTEDRDLIDRAATVLGKSRSEFVMESARVAASDVLLDRRMFHLDAKDFRAVMAELDRPPSNKLIALLKTKPVWET